MATLNFPDIVADSESWSIIYNTRSFTSDFNGTIQTSELPGARWSASFNFGNRTGRDARALQAFLSALRGRSGRFFVTPADAEPLGNPSGSPTTSATANGEAASIETEGWDASVTDLLVAGDYIEINSELKKVTEDVDSDGSGNATINFAPPLRVAVGIGVPVVYTDPKAIMQLTADDQANWAVSAPVFYDVSFEAVEALD